MIRADMIMTGGKTYSISCIENNGYSYFKIFSAPCLRLSLFQNYIAYRFGGLGFCFEKDNTSVFIMDYILTRNWIFRFLNNYCKKEVTVND